MAYCLRKYMMLPNIYAPGAEKSHRSFPYYKERRNPEEYLEKMPTVLGYGQEVSMGIFSSFIGAVRSCMHRRKGEWQIASDEADSNAEHEIRKTEQKLLHIDASYGSENRKILFRVREAIAEFEVEDRLGKTDGIEHKIEHSIEHRDRGSRAVGSRERNLR